MQGLLNPTFHLIMVILVDMNDNPIGSMEKMEAHKTGALHRAFSVLVFNSDGYLLLQRRAASKYHSGGLWTNTCCSHPSPGQSTMDSALMRLKQEMGISADLNYHSCFTYQANLDYGLQEHEFDHVYIGRSDQKPIPNPDEVQEYKYLSPENVSQEILHNPQAYSEWFKIIWAKIKDNVK